MSFDTKKDRIARWIFNFIDLCLFGVILFLVFKGEWGMAIVPGFFLFVSLKSKPTWP